MNKRCGCYRLPVKRATWFESIWIATYSLEAQLRPVIEQYLENIITLHMSIHEHAGVTDLIGDMSNSPQYEKYIESYDNFKKKKLVLPITIGYDGVVPKGNSQIEYTPLYVRLAGIGERANRSVENVAIAAMLVCKGGLTEKNVEIFARRLEAEIMETELDPWKVSKGAETWECSLVGTFLLSDYAGLRKVAGVPDWSSATIACIHCDINGVRVGGAYRFYNSTWIMRRRTIDEQSGILKDKKRESKMMIVLRVVLPLIGVFGLTTGERERVFVVLLNAFIYGLYSCESKETATTLKKIGLALSKLHGTLSLSTFTLKCHELYHHAADSILINGKWRAQSTAEMERYHMEFHLPAVTNSVSPQNMMARFFASQQKKRLQAMQKRPRTDSEAKGAEWPVELSLDDDIKIPTGSQILFSEFVKNNSSIASRFGIDERYRVFSRCMKAELGFTSFNWDDTSTQAYQAVAVLDGEAVYGVIQHFFVKGTKVFALFEKWTVRNPWEDNRNTFKNIATVDELECLEYVEQANTTFVEKINENEEVFMIHAKDLVGNFIKFTFRQRVFGFYCCQ
ncbi:hypothetical protein CAEBREN_06657 [Caenorhabditis brenneri]|uniref:Uncharacterized protein n=1 Tax=Caenorhabditis brenneri TaxID=135651 RepID=G0N988_CAEBE|nr:hypothetical protein CAEBREN_06657 [Caenorhabditis brenneri]